MYIGGPDKEFIISPSGVITADYSLTVSFQCFCGHGGLLAVVPPHLSLLSVRGGEKDHRCGQRDQEDPQAAEEEGETGN